MKVNMIEYGCDTMLTFQKPNLAALHLKDAFPHCGYIGRITGQSEASKLLKALNLLRLGLIGKSPSRNFNHGTTKKRTANR
jgi:hypothetical protein